MMKSIASSEWFKQLVRFTTTILAILYLINVFANNSTISLIDTVLLVIVFICGFISANKINKIVIGALAALGGALLFYYNVDFAGWQSAICNAQGTIVLIYFASILSMPFFYKPYQAELKNICDKYISSPTIFCLLATFASCFLGFYMAMAALPVIYALLGETSKQYNCHKTFVMSIVIGNALCMMCGPQQGAAACTEAFGIEYSPILVYGGLLTIAIILLVSFINGFDCKKEGAVKREKDLSVKVDWKNIIMLIALSVLLCTVIICVDKFTPVSLIAGICLISFPFAIIFGIIQGKMDIFSSRLSNYWQVGMLRNPNVMTIVGIGGFAGQGLKRVTAISDLFSFLASKNELMLIIPLLIIGIAVLTSVVGVHPAAMGYTLVGILTPELLGMSPLVISMIVLAGWSISLAVTPFSAVVNMASSASGLPVWEFSAGKSIKWATGAIILSTIIINIYQFMGI